MKTKKIITWVGIIFIILVLLGIIKEIKTNTLPPLGSNIFKSGPGDYEFYLKHDGLKRRYLAHVPRGYNGKTSIPLVLAFHGGGGNADDSTEYFRLNKKSEKEEFIIVYPEGTGKKTLGKFFGTWNAGRCCGDSLENNIDDVGFVDNMINQLSKDFNIDEKRIYAVGFSNGAQISYRLACELSHKIAAIAPGGSMGTFQKCNLSRPVSVFAFGGTEDPCTPYGGGDKCGGCFSDFLNNIGLPAEYKYYSCDKVDEHIEKWKKLNNCSNKKKTIYKEKNTTCVSYHECSDKSEVILCTIDGGGHVWPGKNNYSSDSCINNPNGKICAEWKKAVGDLIPDFNVNDLIWEFFKNHPMD